MSGILGEECRDEGESATNSHVKLRWLQLTSFWREGYFPGRILSREMGGGSYRNKYLPQLNKIYILGNYLVYLVHHISPGGVKPKRGRDFSRQWILPTS